MMVNVSNMSMGFGDNFGFRGMCEQPPSPLELYYDNGSGPVLWEITPEMR